MFRPPSPRALWGIKADVIVRRFWHCWRKHCVAIRFALQLTYSRVCFRSPIISHRSIVRFDEFARSRNIPSARNIFLPTCVLPLSLSLSLRFILFRITSPRMSPLSGSLSSGARKVVLSQRDDRSRDRGLVKRLVAGFLQVRQHRPAFPSLAQRRWKPLFEIGRRDWPARRHGERLA